MTTELLVRKSCLLQPAAVTIILDIRRESKECFKYTDINDRNESFEWIFKMSLASCLVPWGGEI